ncbi:hypothetical protein CMUS01_10376 [Colletotrichum musicola]|uniref:Uncharacterized protein n=1 Tax=Colletotrichum musicola TaxID=2175873 RepID=A0A8H6K463_9PEZI|nr:hypothetical protein CMUS01_10376 [Colletotrichum musicola]
MLNSDSWDELLLVILDPGDSASTEQRREHASRLRLTCRRFRDISSRWLVHHTTVDISRPETLDRFGALAEDPGIALGIRHVYLRLHFYHPWLASSIDNFASAIYSDWSKRLRAEERHCLRRDPYLEVETMMDDFLGKMEAAVNTANGAVTVRVDHLDDPAVKSVLANAHASYKAKFEAQDLVMQDGQFFKRFAKSFAALPMMQLHSLTLFDRDLRTNAPAWRNVRGSAEDTTGQHDALLKVLSSPMLWEDTRRVGAGEEIWGHVPVNALADILIAIGSHEGVVLDELSILVSSAPDYRSLGADSDRLQMLTTAVQSLDLWCFSFKPAAQSKHVVSGEVAARARRDMVSLNQYIGAIVAAQSLGGFSIDLGEFWYSMGLENASEIPVSVGVDFKWPECPNMHSFSVAALSLTAADFDKIGTALPEGVQLDVSDVYLREGTWADVLRYLRVCRKPRGVSIDWPSNLGEDQTEYAFGPNADGCSRAYRYISGEAVPNPLES